MNLFTTRRFSFPLDRIHLMGILNVTDDSFCNDGSLNVDDVMTTATRLIEEGADILDVGGESARANRNPIPEQEEIDRVVPVIRRLRSLLPATPISLNTWRLKVIEAGLDAGADIINDMGGLEEPRSARVASQAGAGLVIMHLQGRPKQRHTHCTYANVVESVTNFFEAKVELALGQGMAKSSILLDPGLDFAKQCEDNLRLLQGLEALQSCGHPVMLADSRKTFIGEILNLPPKQRDWGTLAVSCRGMTLGVRFFRVHNVAAHRDAARVWEAMQAEAATPETNHVP